mgnify:CR=1 FL=1
MTTTLERNASSASSFHLGDRDSPVPPKPVKLSAKKLTDVFRKLQTGLPDEQQIWVGVALSRPGNHAYIVRHKPSTIARTSVFSARESDSEPQEDARVPDDCRFSFHTGMVPARSE